MSNFDKLLNHIKQFRPSFTIILGDFNARSKSWLLEDVTFHEDTHIESLTTMHGLQQLISDPTHLLPNSSSCIDLIFSDQPNLHVKCHHQIIHCKSNLMIVYPPPYGCLVWEYKRANTDAIIYSLNQIDWEFLFFNKNVHQQVYIFNKTLMNIFSNFIPNKYVTFNDKDPPWMTNYLKHKIHCKISLYIKYLKHGKRNCDYVEPQRSIDEVSEDISKSKEQYYDSLAKKLNKPKTSPKTYWALMKTYYNGKKIPLIPPLLVNDKLECDFGKKANHFNEFFALKCTPLNNGSTLPHSVSNAIVKPLSKIYQNCLNTGTFADIWTKSNIVLVHKKGDKHMINNYSPVSLLPVCGKILERLVFNSIFDFLDNNSLLSANKSGFRPSDSCESQLLSIYHEIYASFDCYPTLEVRGVFLDISKAFDRVWLEGLIYKIKSIGISGPLLKLIESFLSIRYQRVLLNGQSSTWLPIIAGVPQGSILGPLFFLIYINYLSKNLS